MACYARGQAGPLKAILVVQVRAGREVAASPPVWAEFEGEMKQKSESETGLKIGDRVRLIAQTLA